MPLFEGEGVDAIEWIAARMQMRSFDAGENVLADGDPAREMIRLTTYLGHSDPSNTYWYLEAVPELLDLVMARATADGREAHQ